VKKLWKWTRRGRENAFAANHVQDARISLSELEDVLASVEPAARLVAPRLLRRVVRLHNSLSGFGFRVPHSKSYVIPQHDLLELADRSEIGFRPTDVLPDEVILLERPNGETLEERPQSEMLLFYWRLLFHARVHREFHELVKQRQFGAAEAAQRAAALTGLEFDEIRNVLAEERFLLPPYDDASVYEEFAAVYLSIRYFQPALMASFFPAFRSLDRVDGILAQDISAETILDATRLPGTPEPEDLCEAARRAAEAFDADPLELDCSDDLAPGEGAQRLARGRQRSEKNYRLWSQRARRQADRGNLAGAVTRLARAELWAPRERACEAATALREAVHGFVARLQAALGMEDEEPRPWREALLALAHQTPRGLWTVEARLLYDLQKTCVYQSRTTSTIDVMRWVFSLGRQPIRRELPNQRVVLVSRQLRSARKRLARARISDRQRRQLAEVLGQATDAAERRLRETLRPKIAATLDEAGLVPQNLPERVSRSKLVEELLDSIVERSFLMLGEVRDAISRNQLKEPDCSFGSFVRGDAALRMNRRLIETLDGVYEPGDFYLRWILRFSHLMFGTAAGRFLTLFLIIPFGGAFVGLKGMDHLLDFVLPFKSHLAPTDQDFVRPGKFPLHFIPTLALGVFLILTIHIPSFRVAVWRGMKVLGQAIRWLFVDSVRQFLALPWVDRIFHSAAARLAMNFVVKPLVPTLLFALFVPRDTALWQKAIGLTGMFLALNLMVNSRAWRNVEEMIFDAVREGWQRFGVRLIVNVFWLFIDFFRAFLQLIERMMYAVDEWLRFQSGQSRLVLVAKGALGAVWFFVAYAIRICVNLLIEPQINPLKHFPVVTVSHKIMAPIWYGMGLPELLGRWMSRLAADVTTGIIVFGTPGIFGFLVWELKENWRLFAANRSRKLVPTIIGSHGESMSRLLRPGFHSGTVPRGFAGLRRAERKALVSGGDRRTVRKHQEALHHVEIQIRRYVEREFAAWFSASAWPYPCPRVEEIHLATSSIEVQLALPGAVDGPLLMRFRLAGGRIHMELSGDFCSRGGSTRARMVLRMAIINILKTAGVEVLDLTCTEKASPVAAGPQEIAVLEMPWSGWVATWETGRAADNEAWERIRVV
jgi:hypothetical protein